MKTCNLKRKTCNEGFTLLEVLLYSAILAVFLGASFAFISSILGTTDFFLEQNEVLTNQEFVENKFDWFLPYATGITEPATNTSSTSGFTITTSSSSLNPVEVRREGDALLLSLGGGGEMPIINDRVDITDFFAEHISSTSSPSILKIYFALQSTLYERVVSTTTVNYVIQ